MVDKAPVVESEVEARVVPGGVFGVSIVVERARYFPWSGSSRWVVASDSQEQL